MWLTTNDGAQLLASQPDLQPASNQASYDATIQIDPAVTHQTITGFGASITDSSAYLIQTKLPPQARNALMEELFSRKGNGIGLNVTRVTIGASDFSKSHYNYQPHEGASFDLSSAEVDVIPAIRSAKSFNPELKIMATPWSAPGWMKTSGSMIKGELKESAYPAFAAYLRNYIVAMGDRGVSIDYLSIQNEPDFEPADYPGMRMSAQQRAAFVGGHLGPTLETAGIRMRLLEWDHNWDQPQQPITALSDQRAAKYFAGVAWHCYNGAVDAQSVVHDAFPGKETWFTECSGGGWAPDWGDSLVWMTENLIIGTTRNWASAVMLWNIALDENAGPHLGGCGNCRGVITINSQTGEITRNVEYYVLAHASRFVMPDAKRIESTSGMNGILSVAFRNPDNSVVLIVLNKGESAARLRFAFNQSEVRYTMPAGSVATLRWPGTSGPP